jgi:hypothetical protein
MAELRVLRTTDTSNPVGNPVIRRASHAHRDLVSALTARIRQVVRRARLRAGRP